MLHTGKLDLLYKTIKESKLDVKDVALITNLNTCSMKLGDYNIKQVGLESKGDSLIFLLTNGKTKVIMKLYYYNSELEFKSYTNKNNIEIYIYEKLFQHKNILENMIITIYNNHINCKELPVGIKKYISTEVRINNNNKLKTFINFKAKTFKILFFEYGSLTMENFITNNSDEINDEMMQILLFQIMYTLYLLNKELLFKHNDLHLDNIIIDIDPNFDNNEKRYYQYTVNNINYYVPIIQFVAKIYDFDRSYICSVFESNNVNPLKGSIKDFWILFGLIITINKSYGIFEKISSVLSGKLVNKYTIADYKRLFSDRSILENYSIVYDNILSYDQLINSIFYNTYSEEQINTKPIPAELNNNKTCTPKDIAYFNEIIINELSNKLKELLKTYNKETYKEIKTKYDFNNYSTCELFTEDIKKYVKNIDSVIDFKVGTSDCIKNLNINILHLRYLHVITKIIYNPIVLPHPKKYNLVDTYNIITAINKCQDDLVCLKQILNNNTIEKYNEEVTTKFIDSNNESETSLVNFVIGIWNTVSKSDDTIFELISKLETSDDDDDFSLINFLDSLRYSKIITALEAYSTQLQGGKRIKYKFVKLY